ncbi:unnamed protein product, partial [Symbiodinium sp. KB8]
DHIYLWELLECNVFGLLFDFLGRSMQLPGLGGGAFVSAMSELLDVIRMQNAKPLVTGLCEQYRGILEALSQNVKSVAALLERDAKNKEEKAQQEARQQKKSSLRRARQFTDLAGEGLVDEEAKNIGIAAHAPAQAPDLQAHAPTVEEVGGDDDAAFNRPVITPFASDSSDDSDDSDSSDSSAISEDSDSDGDYEQPEGEEEEESSSDDDHEEVVSAQVANGSPMPVVTATPSGGATETACEESMAQSGDAAGATANEESLDNCTIEELKAMISREIMEASPRNGDGTASAEAKDLMNDLWCQIALLQLLLSTSRPQAPMPPAAEPVPPAVALQHKGIRKARRSSQELPFRVEKEASKPEFTKQQDPAVTATEQVVQGPSGDSATSRSLEEEEEALQLEDAFPGLGRAGYWDTSWKGGSKGSREPRTVYPKADFPKGRSWKGSKDRPPLFREEVPKYYFEPEEETQTTPARSVVGDGHYFENARVIASRAPGPSWQLRIPHYLGLNLEPHDLCLAQLAGAFASALENTLQVPLVVPPLNARCYSGDLEPHCRQDLQLGNLRVGSQSFAWPQPLHMTTFFLGGSRAVLEALRCHGVEAALHKQGSIWRVRGGHFVYAEDALLTMSLNMESEGCTSSSEASRVRHPALRRSCHLRQELEPLQEIPRRCGSQGGGSVAAQGAGHSGQQPASWSTFEPRSKKGPHGNSGAGSRLTKDTLRIELHKHLRLRRPCLSLHRRSSGELLLSPIDCTIVLWHVLAQKLHSRDLGGPASLLRPPPPPTAGSSSDGGLRRRPVPVHYDWKVTEAEDDEGDDADQEGFVFEEEQPTKLQEYMGIFFDYIFWILLAYCAVNALIWVGEKLGIISPQFDEWNPVRWFHHDAHGLQKELYKNATASAVTAEQFSNLKKWIEGGPGGWVSSKLIVNDYLSEKGRYDRRLEVTESVAKDEVLVKLPLSHVLSADFCQQDLTDQTIRQVVDAQKRSSEPVDIAPWTWITLYTLAHAKKDSSAPSSTGWRFDTLLKQEYIDAALSYLPLFWDDASLHWLNGTDLLNVHVLDVHAAIETEYHKLSYLVPSIESSITVVEFKKWAMVVMSRGETVNLPDRDNKSQTSPQLAIMPLIDLVDHHLPMPEEALHSYDDLTKFQERGSRTNISYDADSAAVTLKAKEVLPANTAVTVGYGVRSNADYLLYHGFTMPQRWSDVTLCAQYTMIELPLPTDFPAWKSRYLPHSYRFALPACPSRKSTPHVAIGAARFLVATEEDVVSFEDRLAQDSSLLDGAHVNRGDKFLHHAAQEAVTVVCDVKVQPPLCRVPLSVSSERAAWEFVKRQTLARVAQHVGTISEDDRLLAQDDSQNSFSINQRHAVIVRREERMVLRSWCNVVVRIAAFLNTPQAEESMATIKLPDDQVLENDEPRQRPRYWERLLADRDAGHVEAECASLS